MASQKSTRTPLVIAGIVIVVVIVIALIVLRGLNGSLGGAGGTQEPGVIDDQVSSLVYSGSGWTHENYCTNCYAQTDSYDKTTGDTVTVTFIGTQIKLYGVTNPWQGSGGVSIDGGTETLVDFYSAQQHQGNVLLYTSPVLPAGSHTLVLRVTGQKSANATDSYIAFDRVVVAS